MNFLKQEEGFTLLETLVAFAIMVIALAVFYPVFSSTYTRIHQSDERAYAVEFALSKLNEEFILEDWEAFPKEGEDDLWEWEINLDDFEHSSDGDSARGTLRRLNIEMTPKESTLGRAIVFERIVNVEPGA